jgi:hypothetical protein
MSVSNRSSTVETSERLTLDVRRFVCLQFSVIKSAAYAVTHRGVYTPL